MDNTHREDPKPKEQANPGCSNLSSVSFLWQGLHTAKPPWIQAGRIPGMVPVIHQVTVQPMTNHRQNIQQILPEMVPVNFQVPIRTMLSHHQNVPQSISNHPSRTAQFKQHQIPLLARQGLLYLPQGSQHSTLKTFIP